MKLIKLVLVISLIFNYSTLLAGHNVDHSNDPLQKTFISNIKRLPDAAYQKQLLLQPAWKNFEKKNGQWIVQFNEENQMPHYAIGAPIGMNPSSTNPLQVANEFIATQLREFNIPVGEMVYRNTATNKKYHYVHYKQFYKGLEVLWAKALIKMTLDNKVMQFGLDVYNDINVETSPVLNASSVISIATNGVEGVLKNSVPVLKVLPVPSFHKNNYHLVYELTVSSKDHDNVPAEYYTLVDANSGEILYRQNMVNHIFSVTASSTVYPTHPYNPTAIEPLRNLRVNSGGTNYYTDSTGFVSLLGTLSSSATIYLQGKWSKVQSNGVTPSFTVPLVSGNNPVTFDANANIKELSAYQSIQEIHDYYKFIADSTGPVNVMDFSMITNIDVAGTCNAFYNGTVNFFDVGGGCNATSLVSDVGYHEYGHGINSTVYGYFGGPFGNGALNEGYADTWANGLTQDPVLGIGFFTNAPNGYLRRYDINKKVYPQDIIGEVHADGEIIAGAWWDVALNFGDVNARQALFFETFAATLTAPNGGEGQLYTDVLVEAVTNDDDDGNLMNGTPNFCDITTAFEIHGIKLNAAILGINNTTSLSMPVSGPVVLSALANSLPGGNFSAHYQLNTTTGSWTSMPMINTTANNYEAYVPAVPNGTVLYYYFEAIDQCGTQIGSLPEKATLTDPNIPYNMLIGFNQYSIDNFDGSGGTWTTGIAGDNASNGIWEIAAPEGTFLDPSIPSTVVQPDAQVTTGGSLCAVTNHLAGTIPGNFDVDNGRTTLVSPQFDLTSHNNPAFSYYRWYTNDQQTSPSYDLWRVDITNDNGTTWIPIESTRTADRSWRRHAFLISNYITLTSQVKVRFIAEDVPPGGLVEGLIDDFVLWDASSTGIDDTNLDLSVYAYPNPTNDKLTIIAKSTFNGISSIALMDVSGRTIIDLVNPFINGNNTCTLDVANLNSGLYLLKVSSDKSTYVQKVNILK